MPRGEYEVEYVHQAAALWLAAHGYKYKHEARLRTGLIVDFFAWNAQGEKLLLECKINAEKLKTSICQLINYRNQMRNTTRAILAFPANAVTTDVKSCCATAGLEVIALDVPLPPLVVKLSVNLNFPMWKVLRFVMFDAGTNSSSEMVRRILSRDPEMREKAKDLHIDLDNMVEKEIGGYRNPTE